ncbi:hypothetical protein PS723_04619 [Pseudomonas fluorescens]|uniref:Uncharacterized protein n=1 Tax=Pseudomonas fluorescens TaxID=294 RepID=A0A5E7EHJ5_PSEFL|nr:hypothetical protein PS723_04619 [Pseudomonas fluorescens]
MGRVEKAQADGEGLASGQHGEHQVVADAGQADLVGVEVGQPQGVNVGAGTAGVVDHIIAIALAEAVGIVAGSTQQPVIASAAVQGIVTPIAVEGVITAQTIEGIGRSATRQSIGAFVTVDRGHDLTPYEYDVLSDSRTVDRGN